MGRLCKRGKLSRWSSAGRSRDRPRTGRRPRHSSAATTPPTTARSDPDRTPESPPRPAGWAFPVEAAMNKTFRLCGLGNSLVDIFLELADGEFAPLALEKGTMR